MAGKYREVKKKTTPQQSTPVIANPKWICVKCGLAYSKQSGNFPISHSPMYRGSGYLPWCFDCLDKMFNEYLDEKHFNGDKRKAMKRMCQKMDVYWNPNTFESVEKTVGQKSWIKTYLSRINLVKYVDFTYDNTIDEEEAAKAEAEAASKRLFPTSWENDESESELDEQEEIFIPDEVKRYWGPGYTPEMYLELEDRLSFWKEHYPSDYSFDIGEEALLRQICNLEISINYDRMNGKSIDKNVNILNNLLGSANLKPAQKKDEALEDELANLPLGVGLQMWEQRRPLPPTPEDQKDVHGLVKNITTWFFGHTCKMVGLKNSYTQMYEDAMKKLRVERPEFEDEDDDAVLTAIFGDGNNA